MSQQVSSFTIGVNHPSVKQVIEIAEEIIDENKILNIDILYYRAKRRLKIPRKGLKTIIEYLLDNKVLVNRSKYTKRTVLSNTTRRLIYNFIKKNLGAHFSLIKNSWASNGKLGSSGELIWHLDMLIRFNYIKKLTLKNYAIFLPITIEDEYGIIYFLLQEEIYRKIFIYLIANNIQERSEIYKNIEENREITYYRIHNLIEFQILELIDDNKVKINPLKYEKILNIINEKYNIRFLEHQMN